MNLNRMIALSKMLKATVKIARLIQIALAAFAIYRAVRLTFTIASSKKIKNIIG